MVWANPLANVQIDSIVLMATFKLFSPAIINNSPIILIKFYDEKHPYKIILCEYLLNNNAVWNTSVVWKRLQGGNVPEILKDLSCCIYIQLTVNH